MVLHCREYHLRRVGERRKDYLDSLYRIDWLDGLAPRTMPLAAGRWLLLADEQGVGTALAQRLALLGHRCIMVSAGEGFRKHGDAAYEVTPGRAADLERMLGEVLAAPEGEDDPNGGQPLHGIVFLWTLDAPALADDVPASAILRAQSRGTTAALQLVQALARVQVPLWLVTRAVHADDTTRVDPTHAPLWGLGRVVHGEQPERRCTLVNLGRGTADAGDELNALCAVLHAEDTGERQLVIRGSACRVARLQRVSRADLDLQPLPAAPHGQDREQRPFRLEIDRAGMLDHLALRSMMRRAPGPGEIEIEVHAAGLNFLDVLSALGTIPDEGAGAKASRPRLGSECAGRVVAVGPGVERLAVGQRVAAIAFASFASHVVVDASLVVPIPDEMGFEEAATIPIVFATAWCALHDVARLRAGERVLIHAGAGGVGLAAVQIAQHLGAEIFCTAGSEEKRAYLRSLGIPHVMDSRSLSFADELMAVTGGEGVDVVLNSLAGAFIPKSLGILRSYGRFVEIGKRDYYADSKLGLRPFLRNLSFSLVDLRAMTQERPTQVQDLLAGVMERFARGIFHSPPYRVFPVAQAREAFRTMAQAKHMGKLVLDIRAAEVAVLPARELEVRAAASYLITGGLGGLGLRVAAWLVDRGARHLVLVGRRAPSDEQRAAIRALEARDARIAVIAADVADAETVARMLAEVRAHLPPLRGIVHAAGVLDDAMLMNQDAARFATAMAPKLAGAWNLHVGTLDQPLDFFVMFSSVAALLGSPGQGNYAAANAFLDALCHHRRQRGLAALSIDWGAWAEVGMAAGARIQAHLAQQGSGFIAPEPGLETMGRLMALEHTAQMAIHPLDWSRWQQANPLQARMPLYSAHVTVRRDAPAVARHAPAPAVHAPAAAPATQAGAALQAQIGDEVAGAQSELVNRLGRAAERERRAILVDAVRLLAARVLGMGVNGMEDGRPLSELGLDSLMSVELRNAVAIAIDRPVTSTLAFDYPTVAQIADHLLDVLAPALAAAPAPAAAAPVAAAGHLDEVRQDQPAPGAWDGAAAPAPEAPAAVVHDAAPAAGGAPTTGRGSAAPARKDDAIAIIGIACRFPGGVRDIESYWALLRDGVDAISEVPRDRWDIDALYDPDPDAPGKMYSRWGGFVDAADGVNGFDAEFFGIVPREVMSMDPQQRLLLEVAWEALEDAGTPPDGLRGSQTGVFVGIANSDHGVWQLSPHARQNIDAWTSTGSLFSVAAGRISYTLGLNGPCMALDTACSSSLVALHLACQSLRQQESALALAGGVSLLMRPESGIALSRLRALSPDGRCKSFDAAANGYVRADGCGMVVLKRLADALRDGDRVHAVIPATAINQDGMSSGLTAPNGRAQQAVIRAALDRAGIEPIQVGYVETHGTGTQLGDPIEVNALGAVFGQGRSPGRPLLLGAAKSNVGHAEAAAGMVGLLKAVLVLKHREVPPNLHLSNPNTHIDWLRLPVRVPTARTPWPVTGGERRIAGVSSFGFSGTNAHVLLEEAPPAAGTPERGHDHGRAYLLPLSARSPEALRDLVGAYRALVERHAPAMSSKGHDGADAPSLRDIAFTAGAGRAHHAHRLAVVGDGPESLRSALAGLEDTVTGERRMLDPERDKLVFVIPGQGAQWAGMGRGLLAEEACFRAAMAACEQAFLPYTEDWTITEILHARDTDPRLDRIDVVQPLLFAMSVGLAAVWRSWGIEARAFVGHSMGEVAAAHLAGALSLEDAAKVICLRSRLMREVAGQGAMAVVELPVAEARARIAGHAHEVSVAADNGPRSTVLSGAPAAIEAIAAALEAEDIFCRRIQVDVASHSSQMEPLQERLRAALADIAPGPCQVSMYSTVTGGLVAGEALGATYWARNLREPVALRSAVDALHADGFRAFVELSPHPVLVPALQQCLEQRDEAGGAWEILPSLRREQPERATLLESLGRLYECGFTPDWHGMFPAGGRRVSVPTYPWQRQRFRQEGTEPDARPEAAPAGARTAPQAAAYDMRWMPSASAREAHGADHARAADEARGDRAAAAERWLVIGDGAGVAAELAATAEAAGHACARIRGDMDGPAAWQRAIAEALSGDGPPWARVIYLVPLDHMRTLEGTRADQVLRDSLDTGVRRLVHVVQALLAAALALPPRLWLVTRGAQTVDGHAAPGGLAHALLWGLGRALQREHSSLWGGLMDLDPGAGIEAASAEARRIAAEVQANDREDMVAWRGVTRRVARLTPWPDSPDAGHGAAALGPWQADPAATYLVTGGRGEIGLHVARFLARRGARHLVLLGRSTPSQAAIEVQRELEAAGARVVQARGDVSRSAELARVLAEIDSTMPPLRGVFHVAGVLEAGLLAQHDWARFERAVQGKVMGAWQLHVQTASRPLDCFVLFSSLASLLPVPGQSDYAAANSFLDALAGVRQAQSLPALVIDWGVWAETGMAAGKSGSWTGTGVRAMAPAEALDMLGTVLAQRASGRVAVTACDWSRYLDAVPAHATPLLSALAAPTPAHGHEPHDAAHADAAPADMAAPESMGDMGVALAALPPAPRIERLIQALRQLVAGVLRIGPGKVPLDGSILQLGMDSLMVMEILRACQKMLGLTLYPREFYERPTIRALAAYLADALVEVHGARADAQPAARPAPEPVELAAAAAAQDREPVVPARIEPVAPAHAETTAGPRPDIIFVLSAPRSGSTLLRVMLAGHSRLFSPPELHMLGFRGMAERQQALRGTYLDEGLQRAVMEASSTSTPHAARR